MTYFILAASALLAVLFVAGIISAIYARNRSDRGRVYLPGLFAWIGGICGGLFLVPTLIVLLGTDESPWLSFAFLCFSMLGGSLSLAHLNCRITYDEESFTHKNFLGIKRTYAYTEITGIREKNHEDILYLGRRRAMIDEFSVGGTEFLLMAKKRYRALNGGRAIPEVKSKRKDVFNGHVDDAGGLIFVYILIGGLFAGFLGFMVTYVYFMPPTAETCERMEMVFDYWDGNDSSLALHPGEGTLCRLRDLDGSVDPEPIKAICDGQTPVTVYVDLIKPDDGEPFYDVRALAVDGQYLFSFEDARRIHRKEGLPLVLIAAGFAVLWAVFVFFSIRVGRNPERYSKRVIRLFFKDGYVH